MAGLAGSAMCASFKAELAQAVHNFTITTGHIFKVALYVAQASIAGSPGAGSTNYSEMGADELATASGYTRPGFAFTAAQNVTPQVTGAIAYWQWSANPNWTSATFTSRGAMIYNSSASNKAVAILDFGADKPVSSGTFTIQMPTNDSTNATLRLT